jgi:hypothetical protein
MIKIGTTFYIRPLKKFVIVLSQDNVKYLGAKKYQNLYMCYNGEFVYSISLSSNGINKDYDVF